MAAEKRGRSIAARIRSTASVGPASVVSIIAAMEALLDWMMRVLALPEVGLSTVFFIALVASTLVPLGSEPAVFGLIKLNPDMFWPAILAATAGATLGGAVTWWMGYGAERAYESLTHKHPDGCAGSDRRRACCRGCRWSAIRFAPSPAG